MAWILLGQFGARVLVVLTDRGVGKRRAASRKRRAAWLRKVARETFEKAVGESKPSGFQFLSML
jgi:hypothetical protein